MRAIKEMMIGLALFLMLTAIYALGIDDDDEVGFAANLVLNRAERLQEEMFTYTPLGMVQLFNQVTADPLASVSRLEGAWDMFGYGMNDAYLLATGNDVARYDRGYRKGQSKSLRAIKGMIPAFSHLGRLTDLEENTKQYSFVRAMVY
jgi:hypothetical protein